MTAPPVAWRRCQHSIPPPQPNGLTRRGRGFDERERSRVFPDGRAEGPGRCRRAPALLENAAAAYAQSRDRLPPTGRCPPLNGDPATASGGIRPQRLTRPLRAKATNGNWKASSERLLTSRPIDPRQTGSPLALNGGLRNWNRLGSFHTCQYFTWGRFALLSQAGSSAGERWVQSRVPWWTRLRSRAPMRGRSSARKKRSTSRARSRPPRPLSSHRQSEALGQHPRG
jgi:hypothetical protein